MYSDDTGSHTKFILERFNQAEKYLGNICAFYGKICRKEAQTRDCHDLMINNMFEFANSEKINTTLRESLQSHAGYLSAVEDYRQAMIQRIENQILLPMVKYSEIMKQKRQSVNKAVSKHGKEIQQRQKLQETSARNPHDREAIVAGQATAEYAHTKAARAEATVQQDIDEFEETKLKDIKKCLTDFTLFHLAFHARALEMFTLAHQELLKIDVQKDLEEFRKTAPFHRLTASKRSSSETALHQGSKGKGLSGGFSGSMSTLHERRKDTDYASRSSLSAEPTGKGRKAAASSRRSPDPPSERVAAKGASQRAAKAEETDSDDSDSETSSSSRS